ncbi:exonuclease domain-containing protein [Streptomyces chumphonensis]|uniref:exonuclease domain-containing protein n=1 Tax=Streptomyces chumphonensis TaxID=1214925 RepID=UPI003D71C9D9
MSWHLGRLAAFDLETTGVDVENDRIVTGCVILVGGGLDAEARSWLSDPGIDIPAEATDVHHISTDYARKHGRPAVDVIEEITATLAKALMPGVAIVGHNIGSYDLTLLDRECRRYGLPTLTDRHPDGQVRPVLDTRVLDQHVWPYRRRVSETQGARVLRTCAESYGLRWDDLSAHGCDYDALVAARVAYRIGQLAHMPREDWPEPARSAKRARFHQLADLDLEALHHQQIGWAAEQAAGLQAHLRKSDPAVVIDGSWPLRPWRGDTA